MINNTKEEYFSEDARDYNQLRHLIDKLKLDNCEIKNIFQHRSKDEDRYIVIYTESIHEKLKKARNEIEYLTERINFYIKATIDLAPHGCSINSENGKVEATVETV